MKRIFLIILIIINIVFMNCKNHDLTDKFKKDVDFLDIPSKRTIKYFLLNTENNKFMPNVIFNSIISLDNEYYLDVNNIYYDMLYIAKKVKKYLYDNKYDKVENYKIKISFIGPFFTTFILDYYNQEFYIPKNYDKVVYIIKNFKTDKYEELIKNEQALKYLINNKLGEKKFDRFEENYKDGLQSSYSIHLTDGIYEEYRKEDSKKIKIDNDEKLIILGKWRIYEDIDKIDDSKIIFFNLNSEESYKYLLTIRYKSNKTELYIYWDDYLGSVCNVTMRIGKNKAETEFWNLSTDKNYTFYPNDVKELVNNLFNEEKLIFQCAPYNKDPITLTFDIKNLKEASLKYNKYLNWY